MPLSDSPFARIMGVVKAYNDIKEMGRRSEEAERKKLKDYAELYDQLGDKAPEEVKAALFQNPKNLSEVAGGGSSPKAMDQVMEVSPKKKRELDRMAEQANVNAMIQGKALTFTPNYQTGKLEAADAPVSKKQAEKDAQEKEKANVDLALKKKELAKKDNPASGSTQAATYASRLQDAEQVFVNLEAGGYDPTNYVNAATESNYVPEAVRPDKAKQMNQAKKNFINAVLRRESGAAISPSEFENANSQYFPQAGDSKDVLAQKAQNRQRAFEGLRLEAGETFGKMSKVGSEYPKSKAKQPPNGLMTIKQGNFTYEWNPQTGKYE